MPAVASHENEKYNSMAKADILPKGCVAVSVGQGEEQRRRFVVPVNYVNHPSFARLLKEAEDEYGFDQKGIINIPCHVNEFRTVQESINRENEMTRHHHHHHHRCF